MRFGGMPGIADVGLEQEKALSLLDGIYSTVVIRDILEREKRRGQKQITNTTLLRKIILFLADNIGSSVSIASIGNTLVNEGLLEPTSVHSENTISLTSDFAIICWVSGIVTAAMPLRMSFILNYFAVVMM